MRLTWRQATGEMRFIASTSSIFPVAWQNVNLLGRFEFQKQQNVVDIEEMIRLLEQKIIWQQLNAAKEILV